MGGYIDMVCRGGVWCGVVKFIDNSLCFIVTEYLGVVWCGGVGWGGV